MPPEGDRLTTSLQIDQGRETALVRASRRAGPAVVSINVMQTRYYRYNPFADRDPMESFFRGFIPGRIYREEIPGLGSGVIVNAAGIILTNEHVVRDAEQIKVTLSDGRIFDGTLVGSDANYDLAVVRIEGEDLPVGVLGDSDDLMVGEWVMAIGNPFGFLLNDTQPTVTAGVVSALHRDIRPSGSVQGIFKDMIQTDASINPGNSGGPLVNSLGEVVGINTFIFTQSGGSLGIGFAIPINTALKVADEILQYGRVRTPYLGIKVQDISPYLAAYFQIRDRRGLLVWTLEEGSPADEAGIQVGDIIRKVNGEPVTTAQEAQRLSFGAQIGDRLTLTIERDGQLLDMDMVLAEGPRSD
jgi:serine protease Do